MRDLFECTRTITLPQTPTAVLDKFGLMDITFSGYRYAKSLSDCGDEMVASLTPVKYSNDIIWVNSFVPSVIITISKTAENTVLRAKFSLLKSVKIGLTVLAALGLIFQIAMFFFADFSMLAGAESAVYFLPLLIVAFILLLASIGLGISARIILDRLIRELTDRTERH